MSCSELITASRKLSPFSRATSSIISRNWPTVVRLPPRPAEPMMKGMPRPTACGSMYSIDALMPPRCVMPALAAQKGRPGVRAARVGGQEVRRHVQRLLRRAIGSVEPAVHQAYGGLHSFHLDHGSSLFVLAGGFETRPYRHLPHCLTR